MGFWNTDDKRNPNDWDMEERARYLIENNYVIDINIEQLLEQMEEQKRIKKYGVGYKEVKNNV